jgi:diacylglycerol O-acyltransferase / wax synthase
MVYGLAVYHIRRVKESELSLRRLRGVDAYVWYNQTPTNHMHTLKVAILDTARAAVPYSAERFSSDLNDRLHRIPSFRWLLRETPLGLHHPVWVDDPDFDIARHVFRTTAKAPGGPRERDEIIGAVASTPLPGDRPLWQVHLVEGLADGRVAAVVKVHHAMADGNAAANQLLSITDDSEGVAPPSAPWNPAPVPSRSTLIWQALRAHPPQARRLAELVRQTQRGRRAAKEYWDGRDDSPTRPFSGPRTFLNGTIDQRRGFATTAVPLQAVNTLRGSDYSVNDFVLAIATGALRRILLDHNDLPGEALVAYVPSATSRLPDRLYGNSVGPLFAQLPVHIDDCRRRLPLIHDGMQSAREANDLLGPHLFDDWLEYVPPKLFTWIAGAYSRSKLVAGRRPRMNVLVSNVRGPSRPLSLFGLPICDFYSVGPLDIGMALNITVWSYAGNLNFTVLTCPAQLPDAHAVTAAIQDAFHELQSVLGCGTEDRAARRKPNHPRSHS